MAQGVRLSDRHQLWPASRRPPAVDGPLIRGSAPVLLIHRRVPVGGPVDTGDGAGRRRRHHARRRDGVGRFASIETLAFWAAPGSVTCGDLRRRTRKVRAACHRHWVHVWPGRRVAERIHVVPGRIRLVPRVVRDAEYGDELGHREKTKNCKVMKRKNEK